MAKAEESAERGVDEPASVFVAFCARNGIHVDDRREAQLKRRMRDVDDVREAIQEADSLWTRADRDSARFRQAAIDLGDRGRTKA